LKAEKSFISILDFPEATELEKGQGHKPWFTNFKTHPKSQSGPPGSQYAAIERAWHDMSLRPHAVDEDIAAV
jgi:hypothetical protein